MYGIYDLKEYETCVGMFDTISEVAKFFKTTKGTILPYVTRKQLRGSRYLIVKVNEFDYKFVIHNRLPSLNDYVDACRYNKYQAAAFKKRVDSLICYEIRSQLNDVHIEKPVIVHLHFIEENKKRDVDNVYSASKYILDALVKMEVLKNHNPKHVVDIKYSHEYARESKVIVELEEIE